MKVNRPGSPLGGGTEPLEPLDPRDLQRAVKGERFAAVLNDLEAQAGAGGAGDVGGSGAATNAGSATRSALEEIAKSTNLISPEEVAGAVRRSAALMVRSRLKNEFLESDEGSRLVEEMSEYVASDPLLRGKLLAILQKIKATQR